MGVKGVVWRTGLIDKFAAAASPRSRIRYLLEDSLHAIGRTARLRLRVTNPCEMRYVVVMLARFVVPQGLFVCVLACSTAAPEPGDASGGAGSAGAAVTTAGMASSGTSGAATTAGSAGSSSTGGASAGTSNTGGGGTAGSASGSAGSGAAGGPSSPELEKFSFFLTSLASIRKVSGNQEGFGGDLTFGETGEGAGLRGADKICKAIAELGMPGAGAKDWRAFLSTTKGGPNGGPLHARTRIGNGPWYDAAGRVVSMTLESLIGGNRPGGADQAIRDDLPNEFGIPNHAADAPGCSGGDCPDNHQVLTGTNCLGELYTGGGSVGGQNEITSDCTKFTPPDDPVVNAEYTCNDWTSKAAAGKPWCGHSWPRQGSGLSWMSAARDGGCAPCARLIEMGGVTEACVGSAGGYGGFYCFEYKP
jgi:hypothetical protein